MRTALTLVLLIAACGGGGSGDDVVPTIDAAPDAAIPPAETSCFDGLDDDHNGLPDCAEPTCAVYASCVSAEIPAGWDGYTALYDGPSPGEPACPGAFATMIAPGRAGLTAPDATCTPCTCGAPSAGACAASGGVATVMPVMYATKAVACEGADPAAIGCTGTESCQPRPPVPFESGLCVHHSGAMMCPTGSVFTDRHLFFAALFDTRGCAACTCGAPAGSVCPVSGGTPSGRAMELQPSTYCCIP